ncbi:type II toxin-antitoxin system RelE/ParE family toxin [Ekhidna sp.]|uniref:type II toxin-antitoxin system RelE/ParE family toxin n=1 Tax=Ekhidna sp. TaxID=2608089 RepID=UPI003B50C55B
MSKPRIVWSIEAKNTLKEIYDYYKDKSLQGAKNVRYDLLKAPKKIVFAKQYQEDEINPKYRRIVVRHYKLLYLEKDNRVEVIDIVSSLQSPDVLKEK